MANQNPNDPNLNRDERQDKDLNRPAGSEIGSERDRDTRRDENLEREQRQGDLGNENVRNRGDEGSRIPE